MDWSLEPTYTGVALAAAAVAGGAPLFAAGLRAWRLRRGLARLRTRPLRELPTGLVHVRGRVALEGPLFGPLSGDPCAGFVLDVGAAGEGRLTSIAERRPFRIVSDGVTARIAGDLASLKLRPGIAREIAPGEPLTERLATLLARSPEAQWLRQSGRSIALVERVLSAGAECHVVGVAHARRPVVAEEEVEMLRTGTDDAPVARVAIALDLLGGAHALAEPDLWVDDGGALEFLVVGDREPGDLLRSAPMWKTALIPLGPLLTLGGLLYLANAAERFHTLGRL
jgi:hypothetical protein